MNISAFVQGAAGNVANELVTRKRNITVSAVFRCDRLISMALAAAPASVVAVLLFFSSASFGPNIITCSLRGKQDWPPLKKTKADYCMQYDYNFVNTYCYSQMNDYKVNSTTGQIRDNPTVGVRFHDHKTYLQILKTKFQPNQDLSYMKNYPYNLLFLALLGLILNILWEITAVRRSTMAEYLVDGIDEAINEVISGLKIVAETQLNSKNKRSAINSKHSNSTNETSLKKIRKRKFLSLNNQQNGDHEYGHEMQSFMQENNHSQELNQKIKVELGKIWAENDTTEKFLELEEKLRNRSSSRRLVYPVVFIRLLSIMVTLFASFMIFKGYILQTWNAPSNSQNNSTVQQGGIGAVFGLQRWGVHKKNSLGFDCLLPQVLWYQVKDESLNYNTWKTTHCYFKDLELWNYMNELLLIFYAFVLVFQIILWVHNSHFCKQSFFILQYLPFSEDLYHQRFSYSDLTLLMGIIMDQNYSARKTIALADKVLSSLEDEEQYKFLSVLLEMILWGSKTDKNNDVLAKLPNNHN